ncbi:hypothetical protein JAAARDRAFT_191459 [Jaapia argillacea MUCL 33604]|uniref:Uncharacterized protein n=1 Tax=Jaapia argillacea MUCL 33604 TaxID=933084 RepID=A0A067PZA7_9AGAM|nr:hypothetical protein JAAARDRAFT_191459 [Jaapia argillacea MUCL 33604]
MVSMVWSLVHPVGDIGTIGVPVLRGQVLPGYTSGRPQDYGLQWRTPASSTKSSFARVTLETLMPPSVRELTPLTLIHHDYLLIREDLSAVHTLRPRNVTHIVSASRFLHRVQDSLLSISLQLDARSMQALQEESRVVWQVIPGSRREDGGLRPGLRAEGVIDTMPPLPPLWV